MHSFSNLAHCLGKIQPHILGHNNNEILNCHTIPVKNLRRVWAEVGAGGLQHFVRENEAFRSILLFLPFIVKNFQDLTIIVFFTLGPYVMRTSVSNTDNTSL